MARHGAHARVVDAHAEGDLVRVRVRVRVRVLVTLILTLTLTLIRYVGEWCDGERHGKGTF